MKRREENNEIVRQWHWPVDTMYKWFNMFAWYCKICVDTEKDRYRRNLHCSLWIWGIIEILFHICSPGHHEEDSSVVETSSIYKEINIESRIPSRHLRMELCWYWSLSWIMVISSESNYFKLLRVEDYSRCFIVFYPIAILRKLCTWCNWSSIDQNIS